MDSSNKLLSDIVIFRTYSKYLPTFQRRESFEETVNRCMNMHLDRFPKLSKEIVKAFGKVHNYEIVPSMRSLQFGQEAILKNNLRSFNCSYGPIDDPRAFGEVMFILLSGSGNGFSVQKHHVNKLPEIKLPKEEGYFAVHDSIEGWAQAVDVLMEAYFQKRIRPQFDFSLVRPKGTYLSTTGAKAPGPQPLKHALELIELKLKAAVGRKLRPIEVHDIICIIADSILTAGVRRSATISLFDRDDKEMLESKKGNWWEQYPYRARANNSVVLPRDEVTKEEFYDVFTKTKESNSGEPGFYWTNDKYNMGVNPCAEIALSSNSTCNLTSVNQTGITSKKEFLSRIHSATFIGTLQASYTDFPYLRDVWKKTVEEEALLGVSFTGIADANNTISSEWLQEGALFAKELNEKYAKKIGINSAHRITCTKPEGTASIVLGSSSGIHARHSQYYLRRIRMSANDALAKYLIHKIPELMENDLLAANTVIVTVPQKSPDGAILREQETALNLFERVIKYNQNWINPGHVKGANKHNVSATISVKDHEWNILCDRMWEDRDSYTGVSLLPYEGGSYVQAPFEECNEETFNKYFSYIKDIDLRDVREDHDLTDRMSNAACSGGQCEIT